MVLAKGIARVMPLMQILRCGQEWNCCGLFSEMWRRQIGSQSGSRWSWYDEFYWLQRIWDFDYGGLLARLNVGGKALARRWCGCCREVDVRLSENEISEEFWRFGINILWWQHRITWPQCTTEKWWALGMKKKGWSAPFTASRSSVPPRAQPNELPRCKDKTNLSRVFSVLLANIIIL